MFSERGADLGEAAPQSLAAICTIAPNKSLQSATGSPASRPMETWIRIGSPSEAGFGALDMPHLMKPIV
jgi:hypothetical protein